MKCSGRYQCSQMYIICDYTVWSVPLTTSGKNVYLPIIYGLFSISCYSAFSQVVKKNLLYIAS